MVIFRRGSLQLHPGVTKFRVRAGTENLSIRVLPGHTIHSGCPGKEEKLISLSIDVFSCTFMIYNYTYILFILI